MKTIEYIRHEFRQQPEKVTAQLYHFLLDIPYLLYFGVIPSIEIINNVLKTGGGDGGMSPGAEWTPFQIDKSEYEDIIKKWKEMNIENELKKGNFRYDPKMFIVDDEISNEKNHYKYLRNSKIKYEEVYM